MPHDDETAGRVRRILGAQAGLAETRMMGGLAFMVDGHMCCCVHRDTLLVRVGPLGRDEALALPHVRPMTMRGRVSAAFVSVDPPGYAREADLARWLRRALDFVATLPAK